MSKVYDSFGQVPLHVAPSVLVRRWDQGLWTAVFAFGVSFPALLYLGMHAPGVPTGSFSHHLSGALGTACFYATGGNACQQTASTYLHSIVSPWTVAWRVGVPFLLSCWATWWLTSKALVPRSNTWHLSGPRLLEGKEALTEAKRRSLSKKAQAADPGHLALHPSWVVPKKLVSRHTMVFGGVGAGKTVFLLPIIDQIIKRDDKLFLYDVKGDMTAKFRRPIIVSPFDRRSYVWDVARDLRTPTQAAAFAASLIPEDQGNGKFWSIAAQQLLTGSIRALQDTKGTDWGWQDLASKVAQDAPSMLPMLLKHYAKAAPLIANAESQSTASVLATLAGYTRVIDDLALAWPHRSKRSFAITDWVRDDYKGRKQIIVQAGQDPQLTKAYISAMVNVAVPSIISAQLPDNEAGRFIGFVLDELPSLGKINLPPLIDKGRSKGLAIICCMQDLAQLRQVYGDNEAEALISMVGTHVICQVQTGKTRDHLAQMLGKQKVGWMPHKPGEAAHEESRNIVSPGELTNKLGFRQGSKWGPEKWGIRAIVQTSDDLLLLDFPGRTFPDKRSGQEPAAWTLGPAGGRAAAPQATPPPPNREETQRVIGLSPQDIQALYDAQE